MIDDKELRDLFEIESAEHIQRLEQGFLHLETDRGNRAVLEESFREAHSLKGAARMLGLTDIERVSHRIEDILGGANKGTIPLSSEALDGLYKGLDAIRGLVGEAVTGTRSAVNTSEIIQKLRMISESGARAICIRPFEAEEPKFSASQPDARDTEIEDFRINTIRVETQKLDELMTQAGELSVIGLRSAQRLADIEHIITQWEAISKRIAGNDASVAESPNDHTRNTDMGPLLKSLRNWLFEDNSRLDFIAGELEESIGKIRLLPISSLFNLFPRMVRDLAKEKAKEVQLIIEGGETSADKRILE